MRRSRFVLLAVLFAVVASACGDNGSDAGNTSGGADAASPAAPPGAGSDGGACSTEPVASSARAVVSSGLEWIFGEDFPDTFPPPAIDRGNIIPVLRADGIPAIDDPRCVPVDDVTFLDDAAAVVAIEVNGDVRAYPLEILTWHELVNDTIGGIPITISYCPLCNSAIAYDRRVGERVLDFGTSGALTQSSMVMYDRQTETIWTHFNGHAVAGELAGEELEFYSTSVVSWGAFRDEFPDAVVLNRDTGFTRDYGRNPYPGYEQGDDPIRQFITDDVDPRLGAKTRVVGIEIDGDAVAVVHENLFEAGVLGAVVGGRELSVWNQPGTSSALDGREVGDGVDVGSSAVFVPSAGGQDLTFVRATDGFTDNETGSTWNIFGEATAGPLSGEMLEAVPHVDTFWFAWGTFFEDTSIVEG